MDNIQYLKDNIVEVKKFIARDEEKLRNGELSLDLQLSTFQRHLKDLEKQLAEAEKEVSAVG